MLTPSELYTLAKLLAREHRDEIQALAEGHPLQASEAQIRYIENLVERMLPPKDVCPLYVGVAVDAIWEHV